MSQDYDPYPIVANWGTEQKAIAPVQKSPVAGDYVARVLHSRISLEK